MNLINEEKFIIEKKNREQELLIADQCDIIKNYEEEVAEMKQKNQELNAKIKELDSKLLNSIEKQTKELAKKNSFTILEEVKNIMTEANNMDQDPFKTIPIIKYINIKVVKT